MPFDFFFVRWRAKDIYSFPYSSAYYVLTFVEVVENIDRYFELNSCAEDIVLPFELISVAWNLIRVMGMQGALSVSEQSLPPFIRQG